MAQYYTNYDGVYMIYYNWGLIPLPQDMRFCISYDNIVLKVNAWPLVPFLLLDSESFRHKQPEKTLADNSVACGIQSIVTSGCDT